MYRAIGPALQAAAGATWSHIFVGLRQFRQMATVARSGGLGRKAASEDESSIDRRMGGSYGLWGGAIRMGGMATDGTQIDKVISR